ncbi:hypothetical protein ABID58_006095 [Bradyrhizobium sp. S3.2.6]
MLLLARPLQANRLTRDSTRQQSGIGRGNVRTIVAIAT